MTTRRSKIRRVLTGLLLACGLFVCGICGLLGAQLALHPDEPVAVSLGSYQLHIVKLITLPEVTTANGTKHVTQVARGVPIGTNCRLLLSPELRVGDYFIYLIGCQP